MSKTLAIITTDSLLAQYRKGEVKERYFNPGNTFSHVHILSLNDREVPAARIRKAVGHAKLTIHTIGKLSLSRPWELLGKRASIRTLLYRINPDAIRAYDCALAGYLATAAARELGKPSVLSLHIDLDEQRQHTVGLRHHLALALSAHFLEPAALRGATRIICVTKFLHRYLRKRVIPLRKVTVIPNRVDLRKFRPLPHPRSTPFTILSVCRLDPQKYPECLIRAVRDLDVRLVLIGGGSDAAYLRELSEELGIARKVTFIPTVPHARIHLHYQRADCFAIATRYEGFCIPVAEAMACGLPVVASDLPVIREITRGSGVLVPNKPEDFRAALLRLMHSPQLRQTLGKRARRAAQRFDAYAIERAEQQLYCKLEGR